MKKKRFKKRIVAELAWFLGQGRGEYNSKHFEQNPTQTIIELVKLFILTLLWQKWTKHKINKEVFVKHEQAPTAPKLEGIWVL